MLRAQPQITASSAGAGRRRWPPGVPALFALSGLLVVYYVAATVALGLEYFYRWNPVTADMGYTLSVWSVYLAVPVATILAGAGATLAVSTPRGRLWSMVGILVVALVAPILASIVLPPWTGSWPAVAFGTGGTLIITAVLLTCWFWARAHGGPRPATRRGAELQLLAYVLFGTAAYWT
jgi:hypothetical protein